MKNKLSETFNDNRLTTTIQRDILDLVGDLKIVPGMKELVTAFENSYLSILKAIDKNPEKLLTPDQEKKLVELIKGFASGLPYLFSLVAAVSASSDRRPDLALQNFKNSKLVNLLKQTEELSGQLPKVNLSSLRNVYSDATMQNVIQNVLNMKSDKLVDLIHGSNLAGPVKKQLLDRVTRYKNLIDQQATGTVGAGTQPPVNSGGDQGMAFGATQEMQSVPPELTTILATNFKTYMTKIQQKFGKPGLQALKQAIDSKLSQ